MFHQQEHRGEPHLGLQEPAAPPVIIRQTPVHQRVQILQFDRGQPPPGRIIAPLRQQLADFRPAVVEQRPRGCRNIRRGFGLVAGRRILRRRIAQFIADTDVIDDQPVRLVVEDAVDARDRLYHVVAPHRLVHVQRVQAGYIGPRQPHVADNHDAQRVIQVAQPFFDRLPLRLGREMTGLAPRRRVFPKIPGHHHLDFGTPGKRRERIVQPHAILARHTHRHGLAAQRRGAVQEMRQQVRRQFLDALLRPRGRRQRRPPRLPPLYLARLELRCNLRQRRIHLPIPQVQSDLPRRVEDRHRRVIFLRLPDRICVDDVPEDFYRIRPREADRRPRKAEPPGVRQRLGQVARVALQKAILRAVRLVGNDDDVVAQRQHRMRQLFFLQAELLNRCENHFSALRLQQPAQILDAFRLFHRTHQRPRRREFVVQLVVQIVAVHFDDEGRIAQFRPPPQNSHQEDHRERLARPGSVPDHAQPPLAPPGHSGDGLPRRQPHREELVILRALLGDAVVHHLKDNEIADVGEQPLGRKQAFQQRFHGAGGGGLHLHAVD